MKQLTKTMHQLQSQRAAAHALVMSAVPHSTDPVVQEALKLAATRLATARILMPPVVTQAQQLVIGYADMIVAAATAAVENAPVVQASPDGAGATAPAPSPIIPKDGLRLPQATASPAMKSVHWKFG